MPLAVTLGQATVAFTTRTDGDARATAPDGPPWTSTLAAAAPPWRALHTVRQVHGARVVTVVGAASPAGGQTGAGADGLVTAEAGVALAVRTADCAPVALAGAGGVVGVAHAGWRGLAAGVVGATVAAMRSAGGSAIEAALGPCIGPECYEFSADDLEVVAGRLGGGVRAVTARGRPALDLAAAVRAALEAEGVPLSHRVAVCTACDGGRWFSHRARGDEGRQATVVWRA